MHLGADAVADVFPDDGVAVAFHISLDHPHSEMQGSFHLLKGTYCKNATKEFLKMLVENNS